ncbi:MAG: stage V sporulation T C-terminal domain-containing protein [bacterium]|nr:stage V sporulation T C-terminal domain-containing protein [bacterium]
MYKFGYYRENISMEKERNNYMKSTGVVRRVDDLGRIVIPKEIRRTLRIRDGESLEIFVDREMIALKKFSKMNDIEEVTKQLADIINGTVNKTVLVTDRDKFVAVSGPLKKKFIDKNISKFLENIMNERKNLLENGLHDIELLDNEKNMFSYVIVPIIMNGDAIGLVIILSDKSDIGQLEDKLANIVAQFLAKHIEE